MSNQQIDDASVQSTIRRREYKHLLAVGGQAAENIDNNSVADNLEALRDLLLKSNDLARQGNLADRVGQSAEVVLDAQVCKLASDLMGTTVQKIENDQFSDDTFAVELLKYMKMDDCNISDWSRLNKFVVGKAKTFSMKPSLHGTFEFEAVASGSDATQKERRVRRKAEVAAEKRPIAVTQPGNTEKSVTKVEQVFEIIKKVYTQNGGKPIPYFQLVIDPSNMMYTFDNTFQVSFLFRDGLIAFVKDEEGLPAIKPVSESGKLKRPSEMTSFTSSLNNTLIQKYIKKYNIRTAMINIKRE